MLDNNELWAVSIASGIRSIGFGATWPFMALFFNIDLGVPVYVVGIIFTLLSVGSIIFSLLGGGLSDFIGRKKTLLIGSTISSILFISVALNLYIGASVLIIVTLFILTSIGGALVFPSASAIVADVTAESERMNGYVLYRIMSNLGWAIGPLTGSLIINLGIFWIFVLVAACSVIQGLIVKIFIRDRWKERKTRDGTKGEMHVLVYDRYLLAFTIGTFFVTLVSSQFTVTLPVYSNLQVGIPENMMGYIYAVNGTVVVLGQYPITNFMKRYPEMVSLIAGTIAYSLGYFLVSLSSNLPDLMLDMLIITIGENLVSPVMNSIVSKIAPENKVGRYLGFMGTVNSAGRAIGPSIGSFFLSVYAFRGLYVWSSVDLFGVLAIIAFAIFVRMGRNKSELKKKVDYIS
ncbi:MAG: MFS transporter [Candidatus Thermoplasmatota archaeon]|nr:MFS transporter [Candidatus Thermoplasmatota archaeon]MDA8144211.1 MFS transporter [Thermoplasmatales archaeon]